MEQVNYALYTAGSLYTVTAMILNQYSSKYLAHVIASTSASMEAGDAAQLISYNNLSTYLGFDAEL
jgi:hypothetical protein